MTHLKTKQTKTDKFEVQIGKNIKKFLSQLNDNKYKNLEVSHSVDVDKKYYSDIKISNPKNNKNIWVEVKLNKYANLGSPSFKYEDGMWTCSTMEDNNPLTDFFLEKITENSKEFIQFCKDHLKKDDIKIPTELPQVMEQWKKSKAIDDTENDVLFITNKIQIDNFGSIISDFYKTAKSEPVYYIQVDDDLYIIDKKYNPLNLKTKTGEDLLPLSDVYKKGRLQFRAKGMTKGDKYYYSIVCDVKILADEEHDEIVEGYECSFKTKSKFPVITQQSKIAESVEQMTEQKKTERKTIAFCCGSYKPPTKNHFEMVKHYSTIADKVIVLISNPQEEENIRTTEINTFISPKDSKRIWNYYISELELENVNAIISKDGSPVTQMIDLIRNLNDCDVIIGVGKKNSDYEKYESLIDSINAPKSVKILNVKENAYGSEDDALNTISASDVRNNINNEQFIRKSIPEGLKEETINKIIDILQKKTDLNTLKENIAHARDVFESVNLDIDDKLLNVSDLYIKAYNNICNGNLSLPESDPEKAIQIIVKLPTENTMEIFLDGNTMEWDSRIDNTKKLSPDQMGQFFQTDVFKKIINKIKNSWPTQEDETFKDLYGSIINKKICIDPVRLDEDGEFRKANIDKNRSRETNVAGQQERTNSGRQIVSFSDFGFRHTDEEMYICWPYGEKDAFKWSRWYDWTKIKPLCRMRFQHNSYLYGLSLSPFCEDDDNRGFRSYNLSLDPKLQYCTPIETIGILQLSQVQRFTRRCLKILNKYMSMTDEEIFEQINNPEKCTINEIRETKKVIKNTMKALRDNRQDTYIYT